MGASSGSPTQETSRAARNARNDEKMRATGMRSGCCAVRARPAREARSVAHTGRDAPGGSDRHDVLFLGFDAFVYLGDELIRYRLHRLLARTQLIFGQERLLAHLLQLVVGVAPNV